MSQAVSTGFRGVECWGSVTPDSYWHLRYKLLQHPLREVDPTDTLADWLGSSDRYAERLSWDAAGFQAARNL